MTRAFFDSNVLIYSVTANDARQPVARTLVTGGGVISVQSLNEFVNVARRKLKMPWDDVLMAEDLILASCEPPLTLTFGLHQRGVGLAERYKLALYDAMIVSAALTAGCDILYSEDMHEGFVIDGTLTVRNPFVQTAG